MNGVITIYGRRRKSSKVCSWQNQLFANQVANDNENIFWNTLTFIYLYIHTRKISTNHILCPY